MAATTTKKPKNPFASVGDWTPEKFKDVEIVIGRIDETTNDYTRNINPEANYWKAPVSFKLNGSESHILKQFNVPVPYNKGSKYGVEFMHVELPVFIGEAIVAAANKAGIRVEMAEEKLISTPNQWWKTVNKLADATGIVTKEGAFVVKDFGHIFRTTKNGIIVNLDYVVSIRLSKKGDPTRTDKDVFKVVIDCSRASIKKTKVDVDPPTTLSSVPTQRAAKEDVATDDLLEELKLMGLE